MPALSADAIKEAVLRFLPKSLSENVFVRSMLAGAAAIAILLAVPIWAPVGVVGATGWIIVYIVVTGTFSYELANAAWKRWREMTSGERADFDAKLETLKKARDEGVITEDEYKAKAKKLLDGMLGSPTAD